VNALIIDRSPARAALDRAEEVWRDAVQAAASGHGDWGHARQAGEAVHQARAALTTAKEATP
jgi:hypothetical protein